MREGERLRVADRGVPGRCRAVCRTAQRACRNILDAQDTELSEILWDAWKRNPDRAEEHARALFHSLCADTTCARPPPPLPEQWVLPEVFEPLSEEDLELESFKREMKGQGLGMEGMDLHVLGKDHLGEQLEGGSPHPGEAFSELVEGLDLGVEEGEGVTVVEL